MAHNSSRSLYFTSKPYGYSIRIFRLHGVYITIGCIRSCGMFVDFLLGCTLTCGDDGQSEGNLEIAF